MGRDVLVKVASGGFGGDTWSLCVACVPHLAIDVGDTGVRGQRMCWDVPWELPSLLYIRRKHGRCCLVLQAAGGGGGGLLAGLLPSGIRLGSKMLRETQTRTAACFYSPSLLLSLPTGRYPGVRLFMLFLFVFFNENNFFTC